MRIEESIMSMDLESSMGWRLRVPCCCLCVESCLFLCSFVTCCWLDDDRREKYPYWRLFCPSCDFPLIINLYCFPFYIHVVNWVEMDHKLHYIKGYGVEGEWIANNSLSWLPTHLQFVDILKWSVRLVVSFINDSRTRTACHSPSHVQTAGVSCLLC